MNLWTIWGDYFATGEGRTIQVLITYAENEADAIKKFGVEFDPYFAIGAEAKEGIIENELTQYLFSEKILQRVKEIEGVGNVKLSSEFHFNFS